MIRKLILGALVTTPLIVLNSVLPIYLQGSVGAQQILNIGLMISTFAFFIWSVNITLVSTLNVPRNWKLYALSFLIIFLIGFPFRFIAESIFPISSSFVTNPALPSINGLVFNGIVWTIIELVRSAEQRKEAQATIDKLKIENLEAQKQSLIKQIQPHFLFNALSTLKSLISEDQKDAEAYTVKLSNFLRYSFSGEPTDLTTLKRELEFVQNYIELQSIRFEGAFKYEIDIPKEVMHLKLPVFALQTLVENIFKHNYFSEQKPLQFTIKYGDESLVVWNQKVGLKLTERNETGLLNLNKRYELTNGTAISILNGEHEFSVIIPLIK